MTCAPRARHCRGPTDRLGSPPPLWVSPHLPTGAGGLSMARKGRRRICPPHPFRVANDGTNDERRAPRQDAAAAGFARFLACLHDSSRPSRAGIDPETPSPGVPMRMIRRRLAGAVVWLLACQVAVTTASAVALVLPPAGMRAPATATHACCCCSGGKVELACPMRHHGAAAGSQRGTPPQASTCRLQCCAAGHDSMTLVGIVGLDVPAARSAVTGVFTALPPRQTSNVSSSAIRVPSPPPRAQFSRP